MSTSVPSSVTALVINDNKVRVAKHATPKIRDTYILAKVECIALNPTDWKHISRKIAAPNGISGCDFSGTVVQVGPGVTKSLQPGDRIAATTHGANFNHDDDGCFAEYAVAKGDLVVKIPDTMSFEQAATFPLGVSTVGQGLYQKALKLKLPTEPTTGREWVLIYGGSSATGSLGVQFARLSGYRVVATASPHNHDFVKSLGAEAVFNYKDADCGEQINKYTNNSLKLAWDTISLKPSAAICAKALSSDPSGARYGSILPVKLPRDDEIEETHTFMYTIFNEPFTKGGRETPAVSDDFEFAKKFFAITEKLLADGKLKTHPEKVGQKGLEGALHGMKDMQQDKVSGQKMVYRVAETPEGSNAAVEL